jgi:arabinofuranosyltransferase
VRDTDPSSQPSGLPRPLTAFLTLVFAVILIRTAWLSDDAAITLRTVLNVTHGFGLTYNIVERVQAFTHPLWLGLLTAAYLLTSHIYVAVFGVSILLSLGVFWMALASARSAMQAAIVAIALMSSNAFVDFATSGLENPLACVLIALFLRVFLDERLDRRRWLTGLWTIAACLYLTRPDAVLFVLPLTAVGCWRVRRLADNVLAFGIGTLPASAWTVFALFYYGFPFPNTAYAKLAMGISPGDIWMQGVLYLVDSIDRDPITLTVIAFATILGLARPTAAARGGAAGLILYLLFIVSIGGDFMSGRFLAVPLFLAALVIARLTEGPRALWVPAAAVIALVGTAASHVPLWSDSRFGDVGPKPSGIVNERAVYFRDKSLVLAKRGTFRDQGWPKNRRLPTQMRVLETCGLMGTSGLEYGPYAYLLDTCGLADPLMARLPSLFNSEWRTGHYRRMIPAGYRESVVGSTNLVQDPALHQYYDHLRTITRGPLWSLARLRTIVAMNRHAYEGLVNRTYYRHGGSVLPIEDLQVVRAEGTSWNDPGNHVLTGPLAIACARQQGRRYLDVTLDSDDGYLLTFLDGPDIRGTVDLGPIPEHRRRPGLTAYTIDLPPQASTDGFDTIVVGPSGGDNHYAIGHLLLEGYKATDAELYRRVSIREGLVRR